MESLKNLEEFGGSEYSLRRHEKEARGRRAQYTGFVWIGATILPLEENLSRIKN